MNEKVLAATLEGIKSGGGAAHLLSVCMDGLASESRFLTNQMLAFMDGTSNVVGFVDPNHVGKALRNQLVLGSAAKMVGNHAVDPGLLLLASVPDALVQVKDYASDVAVLRLCSVDTIDKLMRLEGEDNLSVAVTALTLFFVRVFLLCANTTGARRHDSLVMLWCSLIWITSIDGKVLLSIEASRLNI